MIPYDKRELLDQLITQMSQDADNVAEAAQTTRQISIDAPGAMQTRYGSEKEEAGYLAASLERRQFELGKGISAVRFADLPENPERISEGTLARLSRNGSVEDYFILPYGGGEFLETDQGEITIITPESPLASSMMGLKKGDKFSFEVRRIEKRYQVVDIK